MFVRLTELASDQGSVVLFNGLELDEDHGAETGFSVTVAVDHRPAQDIAFGLECDEVIMVEVEDWQVFGGRVAVSA